MKLAVTLALAMATALLAMFIAGEGSNSPLCQAQAAQPLAPRVSFSEDVLPLLKFKCSSCHQAGGEGYEKSGMDLTSYQGVMKGTKFGPMVVPGDPEASNLMRLLDWRVSAELRMPHGKKQLSICDRDTVRTWIFDGAKDN
ncbi:MAG: c-type cytochrome domain-containing protein [Roseiarcus sp.]|uniref:c-type cytochrome domain-containing protein n=1 Tax=Roseiarcus sp. TaxID=1969460 RepID=UPI003C27AC49